MVGNIEMSVSRDYCYLTVAHVERRLLGVDSWPYIVKVSELSSRHQHVSCLFLNVVFSVRKPYFSELFPDAL